MTAGTPARLRSPPPRSGPAQDEVVYRYVEHSSAPRVNTEAVIVETLRKEYPNLHLTVVPRSNCDILAYGYAGHAGVAPIDKEKDHLSQRQYVPPVSRLSGKGVLADAVKFGKYLVDWKNKEFVVFVVEGRDGGSGYPVITNQYVLSSSVEATNLLLIEAGQYGNLLHNEVWVFDQGWWQKSQELWDSVQKAHWDDVILDPNQKSNIRGDVDNFFDARETYEKLKVPWKRGIIYWGPPGNGKTISVKAIMNQLYRRDDPIPTLYVRTLASMGGPEFSLARIFGRARQTAPCLLVFEDLDSIVSDRVRSYFLNEVDGIRKNDGILIIGSTNHLDRLDPGIVKRPSRFDRKYLFPNPDEKERAAYMKYWQHKLSDNEDIDFPDELCPAVAKITNGFSFAYLQEAMVASLLQIARDGDAFNTLTCLECLEEHPREKFGCSIISCPNRESGLPMSSWLFDLISEVQKLEDGNKELEDNVLWRELKKQVRILREEMGS